MPLIEQITQLTPDQALLSLVAAASVALIAVLWAFGARGRARDAASALEAARARLSDLEAAEAASEAREAALGARIDQLTLEAREHAELLNAHRRDIAELEKSVARKDEALAQERRAAEDKLKLLEDGRARMSAEFKELADQVMRRHGEDFKKANRDQIDAVLTPLREHIGKFETELRQSHESAARDRAGLQAQIKGLSEMSAGMAKEAEALTRALKGDVQKQGAWGEMVLERILEASGLRAGEEYQTQASHTLEDGGRLRPDAIVLLPEDRRLIIDSKVSLTDYQRAAVATTEEERARAMRAHASSIRAHISNLASKEYQKLHIGDLDYVLMFVPIESAYSDAVRADERLAEFALKNDIIVATPMNLMATLRTVENIWSIDRRNRNAMEIASRAGLLYDKAEAFASSFVQIGRQLDTARSTYDRALGQLRDGRGNLAGILVDRLNRANTRTQIETLKELGAKTSKSLPIAHDGDAPDEEEAPALAPPQAAE